MGQVLTIVRGMDAISLPVRELPDLLALLNNLSGDEGGDVRAVAAAVAAAAAPAPAAAPTQPREAPVRARESAAPPRRARRGRLWEGVKTFLGEAERPQTFNRLLDLVREQELTDRNPEHALRIALGKKVATGELTLVGRNRYTLPTAAEYDTVPEAPAPRATPAKAQPAKAAPKVAPAEKAAKARKRRHRPGELWKHMKAYMADFPAGLTRDELVTAAEAGQWTTAESALHAVKICLTRVGEQVVHQPDGRWRLAGLEVPVAAEPEPPAAVAPPPAKIKKRKKAQEKVEATVAPPSSADEAHAEVVHDPNDSRFNASQLYHLPKSRQPR